ncbi:DUF3291 domain-containing protein [Flavivirga algicola]|uniref:DUF3291 domain-containing protein n=1 Tax=Flavivirga algicola TaxID=2729136 RepID=A0ABX1S221_9FLAO|nr:DUF3291 domain-containing protein [Flavivirga algicola]NMH89909.1 DUF3291 domain-containing protein [Flavivirga algicola]
MTESHLAQINIAKRLAPLDDPIMLDFVNNLDRINALADKSEGFVWRLKDENKELAAQVFQDEALLINMSVWENIEALFNYTYKSGHIEVFKRKKEWFDKMKMMHMAFWFIPKGHEPTFLEAKNRLDYLNKHGETPYAFSFKSKFTVTDSLNYKPVL